MIQSVLTHESQAYLGKAEKVGIRSLLEKIRLAKVMFYFYFTNNSSFSNVLTLIYFLVNVNSTAFDQIDSH